MAEFCNLCPRQCNINRKNSVGFCGAPELPKLAKAFLHMWEEPCISGTRGSGAVFFSGCNLKCIFCQNYDISQKNAGKPVSEERLQNILIELIDKGAHNINLVNPSHYTKVISRVLRSVKLKGMLTVPVVYNTNGYESISALKALDGLVDVYLPDFKYFSDKTALKYSAAEDYSSIAKNAILEMYKQVDSPVLDSAGIIQKGLIIRHLILPGHTKESINILDWISYNFPESVYISLMSQYIPYFAVEKYPEINRPITRYEYEKVINHLHKIGLKEGYIQERQSADTQYIPTFDLEGV